LSETLFAVCLGGRAPKCNTELHDVVFVIGQAIEATYEQILEKWFGAPAGLHLDSWAALQCVDGYRITVSGEAHEGPEKLFFVNLGAYADGRFMELHANLFLVANSAQEAKARAKSLLRAQLPGHLHTDDLHDVDDCLEIGIINGRHIGLKKTGEAEAFSPVNGYHIIPDELIRRFMARRPNPRH
jgi:Domain of Unknown Function (DUF1543)